MHGHVEGPDSLRVKVKDLFRARIVDGTCVVHEIAAADREVRLERVDLRDAPAAALGGMQLRLDVDVSEVDEREIPGGLNRPRRQRGCNRAERPDGEKRTSVQAV